MNGPVTLPRDDVAATVAAIVRLARAGSRDPAVVGYVREAAAKVARGREGGAPPLVAFRAAYDALRATWTHVEDPYSEEYVAPAPVSLAEPRAGDCDDAAVLTLALARASGLRAAVAVLSAPGDDGAPEAFHVRADVEDPDRAGVWLPADLSRLAPLGVLPPEAPDVTTWREPLDAVTPPGVGFLPALIAAAAGIGAALISNSGTKAAASATRDAAAEQRSAVEAQSAATVEAARIQAQAANVQAAQGYAATKELADAQRYTIDRQYALGVTQAQTVAAVARRAFGFLVDSLPVWAVVAIARAVAGAVDPAPSRARKAA